MHDDLALGRLCHVDHPLDNVVGVLVLHHGVQGAVGAVLLAAHLVDEQGPLSTRRVDHTLLHHVAKDRGTRQGPRLNTASGIMAKLFHSPFLNCVNNPLENIKRAIGIVFHRFPNYTKPRLALGQAQHALDLTSLMYCRAYLANLC